MLKRHCSVELFFIPRNKTIWKQATKQPFTNNRVPAAHSNHTRMSSTEEKQQENDIVVAVIRILFDFHHGTLLDLLTIRDLGRLSICSKKIASLFRDALVWKSVFRKVTDENRKEYTSLYNPGHFLQTGHYSISWTGEGGLMSCFSNPSKEVIETLSGGYKQALGCLLGKACNRCGGMTGLANPLTMQRLCGACHDNESSDQYLISKSKAKEAFLLSEKDCKALPNATFEGETFVGKPCTQTLLLVSHVKEAAFRKYGGAGGLASEIQRRKATAQARYSASQSTTKPQKKRSKIERLSDRPADGNLKNLRFWSKGVTIGTIVGNVSGLKLAPSRQCSVRGCDCQGSLAAIVMHEKLEHGVSTSFFRPDLDFVTVPPHQIEKPDDLMPIESMMVPGADSGTTQQLVALLQSATIVYSCGGTTMHDVAIEERKLCVITFGGRYNVKLAVDFFRLENPVDGPFVYIDVCYQTGSKQVPKAVCGLNLDHGSYGMDIPVQGLLVDNYQSLLAALEIEKAAISEPSMVLAMFLLLLLPRTEAISHLSYSIELADECWMFGSDFQGNGVDDLQVIRDIHAALKAWPEEEQT